ncbi:MAG: rhodanese-like domain-containing protein [Pseudomonadota bacterium]
MHPEPRPPLSPSLPLRILLLCAAFLLAACSPPPYTDVDNAGLRQLLQDGVPLYDVRRPEEWRQTGLVGGSRPLTWVDGAGRPTAEFFATFLRDVPRDQPVAVICRTGNRTDQLARELMEKHGYTRVYNVTRGITGWLADGQPVVRPRSPVR